MEMESEFLIIAITRPDFFKGETEIINDLLRKGKADFVHVRKPGSTYEEMESLIKGIESDLLPKIKIHDHFQLIEKYKLGGIHLNSRNPVDPYGVKNVSRSIHSVKEIENLDKEDYVFLSPIFDSISKQNYKSSFNIEEIAEKIKGKPIIALGGVTPDKFKLLQKNGFIGAAMLGYFFPSV